MMRQKEMVTYALKTKRSENKVETLKRSILLLLPLFFIGSFLVFPRSAPAAPPNKGTLSDPKQPNHVDPGRPLPLLDAAARGDIPAAIALLAQGQDVDMRDPDGNTPLMAALNNGIVAGGQVAHPGLPPPVYAGIARFLLAHGANVNAYNHAGMTPLMISLYNGHADVVSLLIAYRANVNASNNAGETPLMYAITATRSGAEQMPLIPLLLKHGASPNAIDVRGYTALRSAAEQASPEVVQLLLAHHAYDDGKAMADAAFVGRTAIVQVLLRSVKSGTERRKRATLALRMAVLQGNTEATKPVIKYLVEQGGDIEVKGSWGWTPFVAEVYYGQLDMVDFLLDHGANVNATDDQGHTALWRAREWLVSPPKPSDSDHEKELRQVARHLLARGADLDMPDDYGKTMLYEAAETGDLATLKFCVDHGGSVNRADKAGRSPLAAALSTRHNAAASFLIQHGADINSKDKSGLMPLHFAMDNLTDALEAGEPDVVPDLVARGADVNAPGRLNAPPLEIMVRSRPVPSPPGRTPAQQARFDQVNAEGLADMRLLIAHGADVNNLNKWSGQTLLQIASNRKDAEAVQVLIGAGEKK